MHWHDSPPRAALSEQALVRRIELELRQQSFDGSSIPDGVSLHIELRTRGERLALRIEARRGPETRQRALWLRDGPALPSLIALSAVETLQSAGMMATPATVAAPAQPTRRYQLSAGLDAVWPTRLTGGVMAQLDVAGGIALGRVWQVGAHLAFDLGRRRWSDAEASVESRALRWGARLGVSWPPRPRPWQVSAHLDVDALVVIVDGQSQSSGVEVRDGSYWAGAGTLGAMVVRHVGPVYFALRAAALLPIAAPRLVAFERRVHDYSGLWIEAGFRIGVQW